MKLASGWYAILGSQHLGTKPLAVRRFARDLVLWRDSRGQLAVMDDLCPHRFAKLSLGKLESDVLECPFHGLRFSAKGACELIPETGKPVTNLCATTYLSREAHGWIWVWWGDKAQASNELPWFEDLTTGFSTFEFTSVWKTHITRAIENQIDYAHLPFVHRRTIGKFSRIGVHPDLTLDATKVYFNFPSRRTGESFIEYRFANIWQNRLSKKFSLVVAFAPIDETQTAMILRSYQAIVRVPGLRWVFGFLMSLSNRYILSEDRQIVESQRPYDTAQADAETLLASDRCIRHFRKTWAERL